MVFSNIPDDKHPITTPYHWFGMTVLDDKLITIGGLKREDEVTNNIVFIDAG